jgi:hypothetical protein
MFFLHKIFQSEPKEGKEKLFYNRNRKRLSPLFHIISKALT